MAKMRRFWFAGAVGLVLSACSAGALLVRFLPSTAAAAGREFRFRVVTATGEAVIGATVTPLHATSPGGVVPWEEQSFSQLFPPVETDAEGFVRLVAPDDAGWARAQQAGTGFPPGFPLPAELEKSPSITFVVRVEHPDHPRWTAQVPGNSQIVVPNAATVEIRAHRQSDGVPLKNLFPVLNTFGAGTDWSESDGVITIRHVDVTSEQASCWLRVVHFPDDGPALFSDLIDLQELQGSPISINAALKPGVRFAGRVSDEVPRPVQNGRVIAHIVSPGDNRIRWQWSAVAEVAADGTFLLENLPADETLQVVALCDGWVSRPPTLQEVQTYAAEQPGLRPGYEPFFSALVYHVIPRLYSLQGTAGPAVIPMQRTHTCAVHVIDEEGNPIPDVVVGFRANQVVFNAGSGHLGNAFDFPTLIRDEMRSGRQRTAALPRKAETPYSAKTDARGIAEVPIVAPVGPGSPTAPRSFPFTVRHNDYRLPAAPGENVNLGRSQLVVVELLPNRDESVTVELQLK